MRTRIALDLHERSGRQPLAHRHPHRPRLARGGAGQAGRAAGSRRSAGPARELVEDASDLSGRPDPPPRRAAEPDRAATNRFAADLLESKGIALTLQPPADLARLKLSPGQRRQLFPHPERGGQQRQPALRRDAGDALDRARARQASAQAFATTGAVSARARERRAMACAAWRRARTGGRHAAHRALGARDGDSI